MNTNIHVPSVPPRLRISSSLIEDLMCDPVMAAWLLLGLKLDHFQGARLRYYWWVPQGEDSSSFSTGKTIVDFAYMILRCMLIPDHHAAVYYPVFDTGKKSFWLYFDKIKHPIFRAHLGRMEDGEVAGRGRREEDSRYTAYFKNESMLMMPAPSFFQDANTSASLRLNTLLVEEWTHVDAMGDGIDKQLIGRVTRPSFNQRHPIWGNHIHITAPAKDSTHPGYARHRVIERQARSGQVDPPVFYITYNYKDYSEDTCATGKTFKEEYRIESSIRMLKSKMASELWMGEGLGIWGKTASAFYSMDAFDACQENGKALQVLPVSAVTQLRQAAHERYCFLGIDPAPAQGADSDFGALVVLVADLIQPKAGEDGYREEDFTLSFVYGRRVRNLSIGQWSGLVHGLNLRFGFVKIGLDPGGGGQWLKKDLSLSRQLVDGVDRACRPIATPDDMTVVDADFTLMMIKRGDPGVESIWPALKGDDVLKDYQHTMFSQGVNARQFLLPMTAREATDAGINVEEWDEERRWSGRCLADLRGEMEGIGVLRDQAGTLMLTKNGARQFVSRGKDDLVSASLNAWTAFLAWLRMDSVRGSKEQEEGMFTG